MAKLKCSLEGCDYAVDKGQAHAAHERGHLMRGEASRGPDNKLVATGVPIVTKQYDRKLRMDAIKEGTIKAHLEVPKRKPRATKALAKAKPASHAPSTPLHLTATSRTATATIDISQLTPEQITQLQEQFGVGRVSPSDRLKEAAIFTTVAEMMDEMPPDQVLMMISQVRRLPMQPKR
jgi:hypothetical protein